MTYRHYNVYAVDTNNKFSKQKAFKPNKVLTNHKQHKIINLNHNP